MAQEVRHFTVTIPAGTAIATPATVAIAFPPRVVLSVDWRVPKGPMGVLGWRLAMGNVQVLPTGGDLWVIANGEAGTWDTSDQPDSGAWQLVGYNTGANPHSVYLAFHLALPPDKPRRRPLITATDLMPSPDLSQAGPPIGARG